MRLRIHQFKLDEDEGLRWFCHVKLRLADREEPCGMCKGTGEERSRPRGPMADWEREQRAAEKLRHDQCLFCKGVGRRMNRERERELFEVNVEANPNRKYTFCHADVRFKSRGIQLALAFPKVFSLWLTLKCPVPWGCLLSPSRMGYDSRTVGAAVSSGRLRVKLLYPDYGSTSEPRFTWTRFLRGGRDRRRKHRPYPCSSKWKALDGWEFAIRLSPLALIFGERTRTNVEEGDEIRCVIPMPEGNYPATFKAEKWTYARPRWQHWPLSPEVIHHGDITPDTPIPCPGKGENSWDCEDDASWSMSGAFATPEAAVAALMQSSLRSRRLYAGPGWTPDKGWPEGIERAVA